MSPDRTIAIGAFCESILVEPQFNELVQEFEKTASYQFLSTKPDDVKSREEVYATMHGFRLFLGFMQTIVKEAEQILAPNQPKDGPNSAPEPDEIVFDIYRPE